MKNLIFGMLVIFLTGSFQNVSAQETLSKKEQLLIEVFTTAIKLHEKVASLEGDTTWTPGTISYSVSIFVPIKRDTIFFGKGGNTVQGITWYQITFKEEGIIIAWTSALSIGNVRFPEGNYTIFMDNQSDEWALALHEKNIFNQKTLRKILRRLKKVK